MADLIDRQAAIDALCSDLCGGNHDCRFYPDCDNLKPIQVLPSAERHGKWLHKNSTFKNHWLCSECDYIWYFDTKEASYCPHCGARMRGE